MGTVSAREEEVATVVVSLAVKPGHDREFEAWQARVDRQAASFPGFVNTETVKPVPGVQDDWVTIYRFGTSGRLLDWMRSTERRDLLAEGDELFAGEARQTAMGGGQVADGGVTAIIPHKIRPGHLGQYLKLQREFDLAEKAFPGFQGYELLKPAGGVQDEWTALMEFDTKENLDRWLRSPERAQLVERLADCVENFDVKTVGSSFGSWFKFNASEGGVAPNWKQAMAVLVGLYPLVMLITLLLSPLLDDDGLPFYLTIFVGNAISVSLLTWTIMPLVNRALGTWLDPRADRRVTALGAAAVVLVYGMSIAIFALVR